MNEVIKNSIKINDTREYNLETNSFSWPLGTFVLHNKTYNIVGTKMVYITEDGSYYFTSFSNEAVSTLQNLGYDFDSSLYVPFQNGSVPDDKTKLAEIKRIIKEISNKRMEDYYKASKTKLLKLLPNDAYELSLEIPEGGIRKGNEIVAKPVDGWLVEKCIGYYVRIGEDYIIFVDNNGKLFISPLSNKLINYLGASNYYETSETQNPLGAYVPRDLFGLDPKEITSPKDASIKWGELLWQAEFESKREKEEKTLRAIAARSVFFCPFIDCRWWRP